MLRPGARVTDIGCGPGHVTAYLAERGLAADGVDLSPAMIEVARSRHPVATFRVGSMLALGGQRGSLDGALAWYSVIHLSDDNRPLAYAEFARAVRPGGWLLLGFHVGGHSGGSPRAPGHVERVTTWWNEPVDLSFHYLSPAEESASLVAAGWEVMARLEREPMVAAEAQTHRCYLLARARSNHL